MQGFLPKYAQLRAEGGPLRRSLPESFSAAVREPWTMTTGLRASAHAEAENSMCLVLV